VRSFPKNAVLLIDTYDTLAGAHKAALVGQEMAKQGNTLLGVRLDSGDSLPADFIFLAMGVTPSSIFADSGMATGPDGGLRVNRFLQCTQHPDIFGGGDCIYYEDRPLDKVGVYAVRQNPVLLHNIQARLNGTDLTPFDPGGDYLLIFNLGGGVGVLKKRWLTFGGRTAFLVKDTIDRRFMRTFQAVE
jgi:NADH dehydrogenase FAD-containing subunit